MANYSICIGVSDYDSDSDLQPLSYAHKDAQDLHELFTDKLKFKKTQLFRSHSSKYDRDYELATYITITKEISKSFKKNKKKPLTWDDTFWFFFSGHGVEYNQKHYLLPSDVGSDDELLDKTALALEDIAYSLKEYSGAGNIIMLIDACRQRNNRSKSFASNFLDTEQGVITITSCQSNQCSFEIDRIQNGSFTHVLLECLKPNSQYNSATVERLVNNLKTYVPKINSDHNIRKPQIPTAKLEPNYKNHLPLLPEYLHLSLNDVKALENEALQAQLDGNSEDAEKMWRSLIKAYSPKAIDNLIKIHIQRHQQNNGNQQQEQTINNNPPKISRPATPKSSVNKPATDEVKEPPKPKLIIEDLGNGVNLEMIHIPAGEFIMGTSDEEIAKLCKQYDTDWFKNEAPQHQVKLKEFYLGKYPVTQAQYQAVMGKNPSHFSGENNPVDSVSWDMAQEFCQKLSQQTGKKYQLPSESQWEYACRAGSKGQWCFGDNESNLDKYAWYSDNSGNKTHAVGGKNPNAWGLYDMHGNVWEWCEDGYVDNYQNTSRDGTSYSKKSMEYIVFRGGSYDYNADYCRSAFRFRDTRVSNYLNDGFRIMLVVSNTM